MAALWECGHVVSKRRGHLAESPVTVGLAAKIYLEHYGKIDFGKMMRGFHG